MPTLKKINILYQEMLNLLFIKIDLTSRYHNKKCSKLSVQCHLLQELIDNQFIIEFPRSEINNIFCSIKSLLQDDPEINLTELFGSFTELCRCASEISQEGSLDYIKQLRTFIINNHPNQTESFEISTKNYRDNYFHERGFDPEKLTPSDMEINTLIEGINLKLFSSDESVQQEGIKKLADVILSWEVCPSKFRPLLLTLAGKGLIHCLLQEIEGTAKCGNSYGIHNAKYLKILAICLGSLSYSDKRSIEKLNMDGETSVIEYVEFGIEVSNVILYLCSDSKIDRDESEDKDKSKLIDTFYPIIMESDITPTTVLSAAALIGKYSIAIRNFEQSITPEQQSGYNNFLKNLKRINSKANSVQKRDVDLFVAFKQPIVHQLTQMMDCDAFSWMRRFLSDATILSLERLLDMLSVLPALVVKEFSIIFFNKRYFFMSQHGATVWKEILIVTSILQRFKFNDSPSLAEAEEACYFQNVWISTGREPEKFLTVLRKELVSTMLEKLNIGAQGSLCSDVEIDKIIARISFSQFTRLIIASTQMKENQYEQIFQEMIKRDILGEPSIDELCHDQKQSFEIGRALANHNNGIQSELKQANVNLEKAFHYTTQHEFIYTPSGISDNSSRYHRKLSVLWSYALKLEEALALMQKQESESKPELDFPKVVKDRLTAIQRHIRTMHSTMRKSGKILSVLQREQTKKGLLTKIKKTLDWLKKNKDSKNISSQFSEFSDHFTEQYDSVQKYSSEDISHQTVDTLNQEKHFRIRQWNKEDPRTFFLGDFVGCCLATMSTRFPAMVQRRMDDAILFHVVEEVETKEPIALSWLFFAKGKDGEIYLVNNFIEIRAKYGIDDAARRVIINALLHFTNTYCEVNEGIKAFLMNPLHYGWHINGLESHGRVSSPIVDKVGGPLIFSGNHGDYFNPVDEETCRERLTHEYYYLTSLSSEQLHEYNPAILSDEDKRAFESIQIIFDQVVFDLAKIQLTAGMHTVQFSKIKERAIRELTVLVGNFFNEDTPIEENGRFIEMLEIAKNRCHLINTLGKEPCRLFGYGAPMQSVQTQASSDTSLERNQPNAGLMMAGS